MMDSTTQALANTVELEHKLSTALHDAIKAFPYRVRQNILQLLEVTVRLCSSH
jgi:hypothetical protein